MKPNIIEKKMKIGCKTRWQSKKCDKTLFMRKCCSAVSLNFPLESSPLNVHGKRASWLAGRVWHKIDVFSIKFANLISSIRFVLAGIFRQEIFSRPENYQRHLSSWKFQFLTSCFSVKEFQLLIFCLQEDMRMSQGFFCSTFSISWTFFVK